MVLLAVWLVVPGVVAPLEDGVEAAVSAVDGHVVDRNPLLYCQGWLMTRFSFLCPLSF